MTLRRLKHIRDPRGCAPQAILPWECLHMRKKEQWDPESADRVYFSSTTRHSLQELGSPVSSDSQSIVPHQLMAVIGEFKNKAKICCKGSPPAGNLNPSFHLWQCCSYLNFHQCCYQRSSQSILQKHKHEQ